MKKSDIIREPTTLDDARGKFAVRMWNLGYYIIGNPEAYWQPQLFGGWPDAFVRCEVRKVGTPPPRKETT